MDVRQLKYFQAIAEEGQISRAAKRLNMAQPPLSQQLKLLESELGVVLLERGPRQIKLTEAGKLLQDRATQIIDLLNATTTELQQLNSGVRGTLSIAAVASAGTTFLPQRIRSFLAQYPGITFQFWEGNSARILDLLHNGVAEIGIARAIYDPDIFDAHELTPEPMIAAQRPADDISSKFERILNLSELQDKPLLILRSNETIITDACHKAGFQPNILCRGDDVRSLLAWADAGIGVAIVLKSAIGLVPNYSLVCREIDAPSLAIQMAIVWHRKRPLSVVAKNFLANLLAVRK